MAKRSCWLPLICQSQIKILLPSILPLRCFLLGLPMFFKSDKRNRSRTAFEDQEKWKKNPAKSELYPLGKGYYYPFSNLTKGKFQFARNLFPTAFQTTFFPLTYTVVNNHCSLGFQRKSKLRHWVSKPKSENMKKAISQFKH